METTVNWTLSTTQTITPTMPRWYAALLTTVFFLISFTSVIGNGIILLATYRSHLLRGSTSIIITSLAISDLLFGLIAAIYTSVLLTKKTDDKLCVAILILGYIFGILCTFHVTVMNIDKYIYIIHPLFYERLVTQNRIIFLLVTMWISSPIICVIIYHFIPFVIIAYCVHMVYNFVILMVLLCGFFVVPLAVMIFSYIRIFSVVSKHARTIDHQIQSSTDRGYVQKRRSEKRIVKMVILMFSSLLLSWVPFLLFGSVYIKMQMVWIEVYLLPVGLGCVFSNSVMNPVWYIFFNLQYRKAVRDLLKTRCVQRIDMDEETTVVTVA